MREFATPLAERQRISRWYRERYANDPAFKLRSVNRWRKWKGLEPYSDHGEIGCAYSHGGRVAAAKAKRDERGRFA